MRAIVVARPGEPGLAQRPDPSPEAGEVVLEVTGCGLCGTDVHIFDGTFPPPYPIVPGHEFAGRVAALGRRASVWAWPSHLPEAWAPLTEPLACVVHGAERLGPVTGARALVVGAGVTARWPARCCERRGRRRSMRASATSRAGQGMKTVLDPRLAEG